jgi:hypothetical protein
MYEAMHTGMINTNSNTNEIMQVHGLIVFEFFAQGLIYFLPKT